MSVLDRFRLDGKTALVTGAGQGLGKALAMALSEAGADLAVSDIVEKSAVKTAVEINAAGGRAIGFKADVSCYEDAYSMVAKAVGEFGRLDIGVNNAGVALPIKSASDVSPGEWDKVMAVNLRGMFFCIQAQAKEMASRKYGKIINIGSICGHIVWPEPQSVYSVSKAGVIHLTRSLAAEHIRHGIRINCISPGVTRVEGLFEEVVPVYLKTAPINRIGEVRDHQGAVVYLASEVSDFMVGQELIIDGGYTLM